MESNPDINDTKMNLIFLSCIHNKARNIPGSAKSKPRALVSGIRLPNAAPTTVLKIQLR